MRAGMRDRQSMYSPILITPIGRWIWKRCALIISWRTIWVREEMRRRERYDARMQMALAMLTPVFNNLVMVYDSRDAMRGVSIASIAMLDGDSMVLPL